MNAGTVVHSLVRTSECPPIEGPWSSRWNGSADPTIADYTATNVNRAKAKPERVGDRVYLYLDWDFGARKGLIDAKRVGPQRLVGKIHQPHQPLLSPVRWIGLFVDRQAT